MRTLAGLALFALCLPGCGFGSEDAALIYNDCGTDAECTGGVCDDGICVAFDPQVLEVALEVLPASGSVEAAPGGWVFDARSVGGATLRDLVLPSRLTVSGHVSSGGAAVPCDVTFSRTSALPGAPPVTVRGNGPDYRLEVVAGEAYEVVVQPSGQAMDGTGVTWLAQLPPLYRTFDAPEADAANPTAVLMADYPITYPALTDFEGVVLDLSDAPEPGLQVRAVEKATGRVVSSVGATASDGSFTLHVLPTTGPYVLRISGGSSRPTYPTVEIDPALLFPGTPSVIRIPALTPVALSGLVEDEDQRSIQNALVELHSTSLLGLDLGAVASFHASIATSAVPGEVGRFEVEVLPGTYDVVVTPSGTVCEGSACTNTENLGVLATTVTIDVPLAGRLFVLPDRARLGGRVLTADGRTMADMPVQAVALQVPLDGDPSVAPLYNRSSASDTDATGRFDVRLDLGAYDLYVKPPAASAFPWVVAPSVEVSMLGETMAASYPLPLPVPVRGVVTTFAGAPLDAAEVRAHAIVTDAAGTRAIVIATATTEVDGTYELLLPSAL